MFTFSVNSPKFRSLSRCKNTCVLFDSTLTVASLYRCIVVFVIIGAQASVECKTISIGKCYSRLYELNDIHCLSEINNILH